jgi:hypothetical protein
MKFLIQIDRQGNITEDFAVTLHSMRELYGHIGQPFEIEFTTLNDLKPLGLIPTMLHNGQWKLNELKQYTPVGSVEFVQEFVRVLWGSCGDINHIKPLNVPGELMPTIYSGRTVFNIDDEADALKKVITLKQQRKLYGRWFVKDSYIIKHPDNHFYDVIEDTNNGAMTCEARFGQDGKSVTKVFDRDFHKHIVSKQISSLIPNIVSEWRVFVDKKATSNGPVIGIENYRGDPLMFPKKERILQFIEAYTTSPIIYTLDVMVDEHGNTWVLECHEFFSCGLYGFQHTNYPHMLDRAWFDIRNRLEYKYGTLQNQGYPMNPGYIEDKKL